MQSALSQQVQRLESELGVLLLKRSPHHVSLTAAGAAFLAEARQILAHPARAAAIASRAAGASGHCGPASSTPAATRCRRSCTRCGPATPAWSCTKSRPACPSSTGSSPTAARTSASTWPARPRPRSPRTCSARTRWGFLVPSGHRFAELDSIPVTVLADEPLLLAEEVRPGIQPVHRRDVPGCWLHPHRARGDRGKHPQPPTWSPRDDACTASPLPASPRSAGPPGGRSPNQPPATRGQCCGAPPTPPATCRPSSAAHNHIPTRLARRPKADGALTGPDPVRPVVTPLRGLSPQSVRSQNALCPWPQRRRPLCGRRFR